ncbi:MAG: ArnT family glycosyltransferase [Candidatus Binatia bacterium]
MMPRSHAYHGTLRRNGLPTQAGAKGQAAAPPGITVRSLGDRAALAVLALVSTVTQIPFLNRGISFYDEGSILAIANGLHHGELLYRDRVTFLPPFTYELIRVLFDLFGPSLLVGRIVEAVVFVLCTLLGHQILRHFIGSREAFLGALAFLTIKALAFPFWTVVNYSQIAMLFWLLSTLSMLRFFSTHRRRWLAAAGCGVGLTLITKQNLAVFLGVTLAGAMLLDALRNGQRWLRQLITYGAVMCVGTLPPVLALIAFYATRGTLGDLTNRVLLDLRYLRQLPIIPLPWVYRPDDLGGVLLTYFPAPLFHLSFERRLPIIFPPLFLSIGLAVKAVYFTPLLAMAAGLVRSLGAFGRDMSRADWSRLVLIVMLAAAAYTSMLYRADWIHLMNVSPPLLIVCVVVVVPFAGRSAWAARGVRALCALWFGGGLLATAAVFAAYRVPIDTGRGRLFAPQAEAENTTRLLSYLHAQPRDARILFLRAQPLYYFLTDRPVPIAFDLVMPALLGPADDAQMSRALQGVSQVVYNPKLFPTLPSPITRYAPQLAHTLSTDFRVTKVISPTAVILKPLAKPRLPERTVIDLWDNFDELRPELQLADRVTPLPLNRPPKIARTSWMMYRVVTSTVEQRDAWTCFTTTHAVATGEVISTTPMLNPVAWTQKPGNPDFVPALTGATFEISLRARPAPPVVLYSAPQPLGKPRGPLRVALSPFAGRQVTIRFCTALPPGTPPGPALALAGWAEPRIVRAASGSLADDFTPAGRSRHHATTRPHNLPRLPP